MVNSLRTNCWQDYRIDCTLGTYNWYRSFAYFGIALWPVGFPLFCLAMLYYYKVPKIARRKQNRAEWAAFLVHCMSMLADRGLPMLGLTLDQTKWIKGGLKEDQMRQLLLLFPDSEEGTGDSNDNEKVDDFEGTDAVGINESKNTEGSNDESTKDTPEQVCDQLSLLGSLFWPSNMTLLEIMYCRCSRS